MTTTQQRPDALESDKRKERGEHYIEIENLLNFAAADGLNPSQRALLVHVAKRLGVWDALPSSPDEKSAQEICGRCGQPRSERCGNDFIPMSAENLAKREAAQAATAVNTAEGADAIRELVTAVAAEFETPDEFFPDDEKVSYPEDECHITFGMIRRAQAALASPPASASMSAGVTDARCALCNCALAGRVLCRECTDAERARANTRAVELVTGAGRYDCMVCGKLHGAEQKPCTAGDAKGAGNE